MVVSELLLQLMPDIPTTSPDLEFKKENTSLSS